MLSREMKGLPPEWLEEIINLSILRLVVVDTEGIIVYINSTYCDFLGTTMEQAIGKHVQEVIENTRMHIVVKTGQAEIEDLQPINGSVMVANRYPLVIDDEIVGALGTVIFPDPENVRDYNNKMQSLIEELNFYKDKIVKELTSKYGFHDLVGESPVFLSTKKFAERVAASNSSILITGESGTGKELFAHAIHQNSKRKKQPFVAINCASIPEDLFESELFGYEDGAFTGAKKGGKEGLLKVANNGSIFLDEIGDMPFSMQSKMLRAIQEKEIIPIGGNKTIPINLRILAATNQNLMKKVEEGTFRRDLYYRLNVIQIEIPPLRERKEDILPIASQLLRKIEKRFYKKGTMLSHEVEQRLLQHSWPGNVRELENVLERAINVLDGRQIELAHLPLYLSDLEEYTPKGRDYFSSTSSQTIKPLKETVEDAEIKAIRQALVLTKGNKQEAAKLLGIGKTSMYDKCKMYDIS
ncbi:sigma 54-interacting transcriptional regulator [Bacillaceae bacterium S4-13-58]